MFSQHQSGIWNAHRLWSDDFVRKRVLEHAILVDAGGVRKSVTANDGLVRLHRNSNGVTEHLAGGVERHGIADGVWNGQGSGARFDDFVQDLTKEMHVSAGGIFR